MEQSQQTGQVQLSSAGVIWLKLAVVYLLVGVGLGIMMGASHDFTLRPVHAHVNLLGWTSLALAGLIYCVFPHSARSRLAKAHFWLVNLALPVMMVSLALVSSGNMSLVPALIVSQIVVALGVVAFAANILLNLKSAANP